VCEEELDNGLLITNPILVLESVVGALDDMTTSAVEEEAVEVEEEEEEGGAGRWDED